MSKEGLSFSGVKDSYYYKICTEVLDLERSYTREEIIDKVKRAVVEDCSEEDYIENLTKKVIDKMNSRGLLIQHGSLYSTLEILKKNRGVR